MKCTCKIDIETKLVERFKIAAPEAEGHQVELQGYGFGFVDNTMVVQPFAEYKATAAYPLKKGGTKTKTVSGSMIFRYCPYCGVAA